MLSSYLFFSLIFFLFLFTDQKKTPSVFATARKDTYNQDQDDLTVNQQHLRRCQLLGGINDDRE